jgi:glycosyltransferase involved in cell wall biosynthesis
VRIGIDCHTVGSGIGGNESYAFHLVRALASIDQDNEYRLYVTIRAPEVEALRAGSNFTLVRIAPHTPYVRIPVSLPLELWRHPVDVLHVQYIPPPFTRAPVVTMVHDLAMIQVPRFFPKREAWRQRLLLPRAIRRAARVLTDSHSSRDAILRTYAVPEDKVVVTYPGVSEDFRPIAGGELDRVLERYGIAPPYLLCVGNIQPRKNLRGVLDAFARLKQTERLPHRLVIVGRKAWLYTDVLAGVRELGLDGDVIFTSYVPQADLPALYSAAAAFVYPSFLEGFGFPPLEAMRCGTPVVVSNRPAFPEVLGDAAMMVDPTAPADIARGILAVLRDAPLRAKLVTLGLDRVRRYRWEDTARRTLAVFEEVGRPSRFAVAEA